MRCSQIQGNSFANGVTILDDLRGDVGRASGELAYLKRFMRAELTELRGHVK
jgi:hypothetical protein